VRLFVGDVFQDIDGIRLCLKYRHDPLPLVTNSTAPDIARRNFAGSKKCPDATGTFAPLGGRPKLASILSGLPVCPYRTVSQVLVGKDEAATTAFGAFQNSKFLQEIPASGSPQTHRQGANRHRFLCAIPIYGRLALFDSIWSILHANDS